MDQIKIGKFICEMRKRKNLTQLELAEKIGVTDRAISHWENGRRMPDLSLIKSLCNELDITVNDLLSGEIVDKQKREEKFEENILKIINKFSYIDKMFNFITKYMLKTILITCLIIITILTSNFILRSKEQRSLDKFRNQLNKDIGIVYYGEFKYPLRYVYDLFEELLEYNERLFLKDIKSTEMFDYNGSDLFLIVPKDKNALIKIYLNEYNEETNVSKKGNLLYTSQSSNGKPTLISVNANEVNSNVIVEITNRKGEVFEFEPTLNNESKLDLSEYDFIKDYTNYYSPLRNGSEMLNIFHEDEIYGTWKYEIESNRVLLKINDDHTIEIQYQDNDENILFKYEGTYIFHNEDENKYGYIDFDFDLVFNNSNIILMDKIESVYQIIPTYLPEEITLEFISGQTNDVMANFGIYEFIRDYVYR